jgi:two-component system chemotaxis response regulator CheY
MKILIAEDDSVSRKFLFKFLSEYGDCDITVDGIEAVDAFLIAVQDQEYYDLICLDIMMPKLDGIKALKAIRAIEEQENVPKENRSKIIMTTALTDSKTVYNTYDIGCEAYASKPINTEKFLQVLNKLKLID